jgi:hypothetical protein
VQPKLTVMRKVLFKWGAVVECGIWNDKTYGEAPRQIVHWQLTKGLSAASCLVFAVFASTWHLAMQAHCLSAACYHLPIGSLLNC